MENETITDYLEAIERDKCLRVEATLKSTPVETTQIVYFEGANGARIGPLVRKTIAAASRTGSAYAALFDAWASGKRFVHLPRLYECRHTGDEMVVLMEYVEGVTLSNIVNTRGPSIQLARFVIPRLCEAAAELHEQMEPALIHRDIKPSNIIVSRHNLTLIDLGIARFWREGAEEDTMHLGTRAYAPPEQFGFGQTDERSDVYAIGMVLYYCLSGKTPNANLAATGFSDLQASPELKDVLAKACAFDPAQRYASARELADALACALSPCGEAPVPPAAAASARRTPLAGSAPRSGFPWARVWNALLLCVFGFGAITAILSITSPNDELAKIPIASRMIAYGGVFILANGAACYLLASKKHMRELWPPLAKIKGRREIVLCIALVIIGALCAGALGVPGS